MEWTFATFWGDASNHSILQEISVQTHKASFYTILNIHQFNKSPGLKASKPFILHASYKNRSAQRVECFIVILDIYNDGTKQCSAIWLPSIQDSFSSKIERAGKEFQLLWFTTLSSSLKNVTLNTASNQWAAYCLLSLSFNHCLSMYVCLFSAFPPSYWLHSFCFLPSLREFHSLTSHTLIWNLLFVSRRLTPSFSLPFPYPQNPVIILRRQETDETSCLATICNWLGR